MFVVAIHVSLSVAMSALLELSRREGPQNVVWWGSGLRSSPAASSWTTTVTEDPSCLIFEGHVTAEGGPTFVMIRLVPETNNGSK